MFRARMKLLKMSRTRRFVPWLLVFVGVAIVVLYGLRAFGSFRQIQFAREQGLLDGTASVEAIRPWMTIRYIGVAYAVPEEYIFAELDIPFERRNRNDPIGRLAFLYGEEPPVRGEQIPMIERVQEIILAYREDPVITGLDDVRPWMSIQYIANSTGVPADYIFDQLGIPMDDNAFKPLDLLDREVRFGGPREIAHAVEEALANYEAAE